MLRVREIKLSFQDDNENNLKLSILKKLRLPKNYNLTYKVVRKSLDARKKPEVYYVYEILCTLDKKEEAAEEEIKQIKLEQDLLEDSYTNFEMGENIE